MRQLFLCLLLSALSIGAYSKKQNLNLQGAWKLVVVQEIEDGKIVTYFPGKKSTEQVIIWSGNQVMFVGRTKTSKKTREDYGLGTFKLNGDKYEEYFTIFSYKDWEGKTIRLKMEMKGDTLVQTFPLNEKFEFDKNTTSIEKYLRIK